MREGIFVLCTTGDEMRLNDMDGTGESVLTEFRRAHKTSNYFL